MRKVLLISVLVFATMAGFAQRDSLVLVNGDVIVGELKSLDKGVATVETDYSDDDFTIEWDGIKKVFTQSSYLVTLSNGERINGKVASSGDGMLKIIPETGSAVEIKPEDLVYLKSVDKGFWDRVYASIDIGFDLTKANNMTTFTTRSTLGYLANRWSTDFNFNTLFSSQDEAEDIRRTDGGLTYKYFLPHDWYLPVTVTYLSNSEQKLDARWNALLGAGKYLIHSNRAYWGVSVGAAYNHEKYTPVVDSASQIKSSWEGFAGTELNLFDIGDLNLLTNIKVFPGITEAGRWRVDFNFDLKYDLPLDFYIKAGYSLNYDNQPVEGASDVDYVLHTGVGWEW